MPERRTGCRPRQWIARTAAAALLAAAVPAPAPAATILQKTVIHTIQPGGAAVRESARLWVRLDGADELEDFSPQYVPLDDNRTLESLLASVTPPDGRTQVLGEEAMDTLALPLPFELHTSARLREVRFPPVPAGTRLALEHAVIVEPYFPAGSIPIGEGEAVERLRVEIRGAPPGWHWRLDGPADGLEVEETADGLVISATDLAANDPPDHAPDGAASLPVLRYSWGNTGGWEAVGAWYGDLSGSLSRDGSPPRDHDPIRRVAAGLTAGAEGRQERLRRLLAHVQEEVRYVAVEVGIGGYRPSPPAETLDRRWGDCKDKSFLLIELLEAAGIEAYPTLILASESGRIDAAFPSPFQFNHLIVAVPEQDGLAADPRGPWSDGLLFVDPTQPRGGLAWIHPAVQEQQALVVRSGGGELVPTPVLQHLEVRRLAATVTASRSGSAAGQAQVVLSGAPANTFLSLAASAPEARTEATIRSVLGTLLPGAVLEEVRWTPADGEVPAITLSAEVHMDGFLARSGNRLSLRPPGFRAAPQPGDLTDRREPAVLRPGVAEATWSITLPVDGCDPRSEPSEVENRVGSFRQEVQTEGRTVTVQRRAEVRRRWVEGELLPELTELALAEHRTLKRRIRLTCGAPAAP